MSNKKRYWLFIIAEHEPNGGMADFQGDFDTIEEAKQAYYDLFRALAKGEKVRYNDYGGEYELTHSIADILDTIEFKSITSKHRGGKEPNEWYDAGHVKPVFTITNI